MRAEDGSHEMTSLEAALGEFGTTGVSNLYTSSARPRGHAADLRLSRPGWSESKLIKEDRPGLLFFVESKNEIQIEKAGFVRKSHRPVNRTKVVGFISVVRPEPERLKILTGNGVS